jgi:hypothetical protein
MMTITETRRPVKSDRLSYTQADLDWAAQAFADDETDRENRHYDELAAEAEWLDRFNAIVAAGHCLVCGDHAELTSQGLCDRCDAAATDATIACQNKAAMGQYRVF